MKATKTGQYKAPTLKREVSQNTAFHKMRKLLLPWEYLNISKLINELAVKSDPFQPN